MKDSPSEFYLWLLAQKHRKDEIGDLSREVAKDRTFPKYTNRLWLFLHYYDSEQTNRRVAKKAHAEWRQLCQHTYRELMYGSTGN